MADLTFIFVQAAIRELASEKITDERIADLVDKLRQQPEALKHLTDFLYGLHDADQAGARKALIHLNTAEAVDRLIHLLDMEAELPESVQNTSIGSLRTWRIMDGEQNVVTCLKQMTHPMQPRSLSEKKPRSCIPSLMRMFRYGSIRLGFSRSSAKYRILMH